tara:strand:+ start:746 stop:913 length:168 start_codon:yes stop_codon:yes gene_type:complete
MVVVLRCDLEMAGEVVLAGTEVEVTEEDGVRMLRKRMATEIARKPAKKKAKKSEE